MGKRLVRYCFSFSFPIFLLPRHFHVDDDDNSVHWSPSQSVALTTLNTLSTQNMHKFTHKQTSTHTHTTLSLWQTVLYNGLREFA